MTDVTTRQQWNITNPPPEGHEDVGKFAYGLFENSMFEKERLGLTDRWYENHRLYRGDHWNKNRHASRKNHKRIAVNLIFANIQRTVANLTSRNPVAEVVTIDGDPGPEDEAGQIMSQKIKNWWADTEQGATLSISGQNMETYGITIEKAVPNIKEMKPDIVVKDPFGWFPAPGIYKDIQNMPYMCDADAIPIAEIEEAWGVNGVQADDTYSLLGEDREENVPIPSGSRYGAANSPSNYSTTKHPVQAQRDIREARALVIEVWLRDRTMEEVMVETTDADGNVTQVPSKQMKYPGGLRCITITNRGNLVLDDRANPNVNPELPRVISEKTYLFHNFPFSKAVSYDDSSSIWGFSAIEQTDDINMKINEVLSAIGDYIESVCRPILILPQNIGIKKEKITSRAGLILRPDKPVHGIGYVAPPSLPADFWRMVESFLSFYDRIWALEDVDRGQTPTNIQAASAIATLQERNAVLMRQKIRAMDYLVRERGRWAISFIQNFAWKSEEIKVNDEPKVFRGTDYAEMRFNYLVESGSTVAKTELQRQAQIMDLAKLGMVDQQAVLETLNVPNWKMILERMGENQLDMALNILIQAGLPEEEAMLLKQFLMQVQGGPGSKPQQPLTNGDGPPAANSGTVGGVPVAPQPGVPRGQQGHMPVSPAQAALPPGQQGQPAQGV